MIKFQRKKFLKNLKYSCLIGKYIRLKYVSIIESNFNYKNAVFKTLEDRSFLETSLAIASGIFGINSENNSEIDKSFEIDPALYPLLSNTSPNEFKTGLPLNYYPISTDHFEDPISSKNYELIKQNWPFRRYFRKQISRFSIQMF